MRIDPVRGVKTGFNPFFKKPGFGVCMQAIAGNLGWAEPDIRDEFPDLPVFRDLSTFKFEHIEFYRRHRISSAYQTGGDVCFIRRQVYDINPIFIS